MSGRRVAVLGGGVIGLATAYELARTGLDVTVLERGELGRGCSEGNAGWVTPAISLPVASPGLRTTGLLWALRRDSPIYVRPTALLGLAPWLFQFWRCCTPRAFEEAARGLQTLARDAAERFEGWADELDGIEWRRDGLLMAFRTQSGLDDEVALLKRNGYGGVRRLGSRDLEAVEPILSADRYAGGLHVESEGHVEPFSVTRALASACRSLGVAVREQWRVESLRVEARAGGGPRRVAAVRGVTVNDGAAAEIEVDDVVIATGAESAQLAGVCGSRIPLQAGKGYSLTVEKPETAIRHPIYLADAKVGVTPFAGALRIAGTLELSGINTRFDRRRFAGFLRAAEREIAGITRGSGSREEWVGMRPLTPDGMPVIGRLPATENAWINTGHQMLGVTLAPASAVLLRKQMAGGGSLFDGPEARLADAFDPGRFEAAT